MKNEVELADNHAVVERHICQLTKRLLKAPSLLQEYNNEVRWLLAKGIAESVRDETDNGKHIYYKPHQPVLREKKHEYEAAGRFQHVFLQRGRKISQRKFEEWN